MLPPVAGTRPTGFVIPGNAASLHPLAEPEGPSQLALVLATG